MSPSLENLSIILGAEIICPQPCGIISREKLELTFVRPTIDCFAVPKNVRDAYLASRIFVSQTRAARTQEKR